MMRVRARAHTHVRQQSGGMGAGGGREVGRRGGRRSGMKQRIRGLVSLHEIPFPPASYKGKEAIVHIVQRKRKRGSRRRRGRGRGGEEGEDGGGWKREGEKKTKQKKTNVLSSAVYSGRRRSRRSSTCDIAFICEPFHSAPSPPPLIPRLPRPSLSLIPPRGKRRKKK